MICQKGAFLCAQDSVNLDVTFTKKFTSGLFGGEGFILESISGSGMAFLEIDGDVVEKQLAPGEVIKLIQEIIVAFEKTVKYEVETIKRPLETSSSAAKVSSSQAYRSWPCDPSDSEYR